MSAPSIVRIATILLLSCASLLTAQEPDAVPARVGSDATLNLGTYTYDPSGNITAVGGDSYVYDAYGRL